MRVQRGDIALIDFPYSDRTGRKIHPALVVRSNTWNQQIDDTILAVITSSLQRRIGVSTQYAVDISTVEA